MNAENEIRFAGAIEKLADAVREQATVLEILVEAMPATTETKILGISARTVHKRRKIRQMQRLLKY